MPGDVMTSLLDSRPPLEFRIHFPFAEKLSFKTVTSARDSRGRMSSAPAAAVISV